MYKLWDDRHNELNGNKLHVYRCFQNGICAEKCVTIMIPFVHQRYLAMLRCGSRPLEIEFGRRSNTPLANRICKLCEQSVENEIHLMLECPLYGDLRENILLHVNSAGMTLNDQFSTLLSNTEVQAKLGKCGFRIMERGRCFLNLL